MSTSSSPKRANDWLHESTTQLKHAGVPTARLDALVLLEDVTRKSRAWLLAHDEFTLTPARLKKLNSYITRRATHEPLAYIRQRCEFYGRTFYLNKHTLVPRPESETIIDVLRTLTWPRRSVAVADIGTGSGAIGLTLALEFPKIARLDLYDIDANALVIANHNARKHAVTADLIEEDLLEADRGPYDIIVANLPYVPDNHTINQAAMFEPVLAIFGGTDGLDVYRRLFSQLSHKTWRPRYVLTESLPTQHAALAAHAKQHGFRLSVTDDFIQVFVPAGRRRT